LYYVYREMYDASEKVPGKYRVQLLPEAGSD